MAGHHPISKLRATISPARQRKIDVKVKAELTRLMLAELRKAENLSQRDLASRLGVSQPAIAKMEAQDDVQLSTLQRLVAALGGSLEIIARLPSGEYRIGSFRTA
jgi:DNA-binding XRE family transcriptional regulator